MAVAYQEPARMRDAGRHHSPQKPEENPRSVGLLRLLRARLTAACTSFGSSMANHPLLRPGAADF